MVLGLTPLPFSAFNPIPKKSISWVTTENACSPPASADWSDKILLVEGQNPKHMPDIDWNGATRMCAYGDILLNAQNNGAAGVLIVMKNGQKLSRTDDFTYSREYYNFSNPSNRPNIPGGIIVYSYWEDFKIYNAKEDFQIQIGCASEFGNMMKN